MITVYCVYWGDKYAPDYVPRLRDQVHKHLSIPHEFRCITDHEFWDVDSITPACDYPGWWQKVSLFKPDYLPTGASMFLDLDVSIVGSLSPLAELALNAEPDVLHCPKNWAQSGHGGCQSSVMMWYGGCNVIWDEFNPEWALWPPQNKPGVLWGDQEWITCLRDAERLTTAHTKPEQIVSYKYHCQGGIPDKARVVVFHGSPKPHEVRGFA